MPAFSNGQPAAFWSDRVAAIDDGRAHGAKPGAPSVHHRFGSGCVFASLWLRRRTRLKWTTQWFGVFRNANAKSHGDLVKTLRAFADADMNVQGAGRAALSHRLKCKFSVSKTWRCNITTIANALVHARRLT
jgi:hypothetical protein